MRLSIILIIGIILLTGLNVIDAKPDMSHDLLDNKHYFIAGYVYEPYSEDNVVTLINTRTNEWLQVVARDDENGTKEYLFNLANLHQGWTYKDNFTINYGSEFIHFRLINGSMRYQQDIQRPDDIVPIFIWSGFLIVAVGGGYFYMKKKNIFNKNDETKGSETNMSEEETEPIEAKPCIVDRIFGGTKKALLMLMLLTMITATLMDKQVPAEFINMATGLMLIYFGAGGVKLGMDIQNKK